MCSCRMPIGIVRVVLKNAGRFIPQPKTSHQEASQENTYSELFHREGPLRVVHQRRVQAKGLGCHHECQRLLRLQVAAQFIELLPTT